MTATVIFNNGKKFTYCCVWDEIRCGRGGNEIASCIYKILGILLQEYPNIQQIILWSDSCVAQNKNKMMTTALLKFLADNPRVKCITQKYSEPGHSQIQDVDCVHSALDKYLKNLEIFSILSLLALLKTFKSKNIELKITQMKPEDFKNFSKLSLQLNFSAVPFTKIKILQYNRDDLFEVKYKTSIFETAFKTIKTHLKANKKKKN